MPQQPANPIRPTDDEARFLARNLLASAKFAALGVLEPKARAPLVTRIAIARDDAGLPMSLVSDLSHHTRALRLDPVCSILIGEPGQTGDPLTHPRITLQCVAHFLARDGETHDRLRGCYLAQRPKAKLYIDFGDFHLVQFSVTAAYLNGGFGKAFILSPGDLTAEPGHHT